MAKDNEITEFERAMLGPGQKYLKCVDNSGCGDKLVLNKIYLALKISNSVIVHITSEQVRTNDGWFINRFEEIE